MHFPCIGGCGGGGGSTKQRATKRKEKPKTECVWTLNVITICGNANLLHFNVLLARARARFKRKHNKLKLECKRSANHKWECGDGKRLFALRGGVGCVALFYIVCIRKSESKPKETHSRFGTLLRFSVFCLALLWSFAQHHALVLCHGNASIFWQWWQSASTRNCSSLPIPAPHFV